MRITRFPYCALLYHPRPAELILFQQFRNGFIVWVLGYEFAADGEVEDKAAEAGHGGGGVHQRIEVGEQAVSIHRVSASVRITFN